jgi:hypothetical protein
VEAFVTKLSSDGSSLVFSTLLGGSGDDFAKGIAVDLNGEVYVTGGTGSPDFPTVNPIQTDMGDYDVFVSKFSSDGSSLVYSTYIGGDKRDFGRAIAVDVGGLAYVTGYSWSDNFPLYYPYQTFQGAYDAFIVKLLPTGSGLVYSTYVGGEEGDLGWGIAVDFAGLAYVTGWTWSSNFPIVNPVQTDQGGQDAYVIKLSVADTCITGRSFCCDGDGMRGNVDGDVMEQINIADLTYLVDFLFRAGIVPPCCEESDVQVDGNVNIADLTYLVDYLFRNGPQPPPCP